MCCYIFCPCYLLHHLTGSVCTGGPALVLACFDRPPAFTPSPRSSSGHPSSGETGLSEREWQVKPVLTQHLKPPHKYRLPFPISKLPIHLCLHAYTLLHVMRQGVSLKMTTGHLADSQRVGLWCAALQFSSTSGQPDPPRDAAGATQKP